MKNKLIRSWALGFGFVLVCIALIAKGSESFGKVLSTIAEQ